MRERRLDPLADLMRPRHYVVLVHVPDQGTRGVGKPKRTAEQLTALIKERSAQFGPWPAKMTMLLYRMNDTWEITVSPGESVQEEEFRIAAMWIATQMQVEFDLRG